MTTADDLRAISSSAADELEQLTAALADLGAALQQKTADLDAALAQVASLQLEVARLSAELEECNPVPPATVFGAYAQPQSRAELDEFGQKVGPVGCTRLFYAMGSGLGPGLPAPGIATIASLHTRTYNLPQTPGTKGRPRHVQVTASAFDGYCDVETERFAQKVKTYLDANPGQTFVMSPVAEPDVIANRDLCSVPISGTDPDLSLLGSEFVQMYLHVRERFDAVCPGLPWALILTGTTFAISSARRHPDMFWHESFDMIGIDPYNLATTAGAWKFLDNEVGIAVEYAAMRGRPLIVPEYGCVKHPTDPNARAAWLTATGELFRASGVTLAAYFHADKRGEAPNRDYRFYDPDGGAVLDQPALEAYATILQG